MKPFNDKLLVKVRKDKYGFGESTVKKECGVVVEVPDKMLYLGFHSFSFENSIGDEEILNRVHEFYTSLKGKLVVWEELKDSGRHFQDGDEEFVLLNMTDVIAYSDDTEHQISLVDQTGKAGSFNLS